jgi:ATP-dependent RNA helicase SUPV3L1/SUV3
LFRPTARYFICTVEAMPVEMRSDFVAIDEIQLAQDEDRGHIFTDRILKAARQSRDAAARLRHDARHSGAAEPRRRDTEPRERFSELRYTGHTKITKLPKRTAIVGFSAEEVYAIGELLRRQKGGAAVVMGALSPRTRNAQVEMFQSGEVDYIVATDAIGMGLNLDVDRVVFASRSKFDGRRHRSADHRPNADRSPAGPGASGRMANSAKLADCPPFEEDVSGAPSKRTASTRWTRLQWRNSDLDFSSLKTLIRSLEKPSGNPVLIQNAACARRMGAAPDEPRMAISGRMSPGRVRCAACGMSPAYRISASSARRGMAGWCWALPRR